MTAYPGLGTYGNAVGVVTPLAHKLSNAAMVVKQSGNLIRPGLFWGGNATIVTGKANMSYDVAAYSCATTRGATSGAVFGGNDGVLNVATTAAPGSNSRYDVIYHWHREYSLDGVDSNPVIGVIQGTAAASPTVPSLAAFPGAIELARVLVPAGVTATNTSTTITHTAPFTAMAGGAVAFRTKDELDLWTTAVPDQHAYVIAENNEYVRLGGSWVVAVGAAACVLRKSASQNLGTPLAALSWDVEVTDPTGMHDNTTNNTRITAAVAGIFMVTAQMYNSNTAGLGTLQGRINGTTDAPGSFTRRSGDSLAALPLQTSFPWQASAGDYLEIMVSHSTGAGTIAGGTASAGATVTVLRVG